jgi:phage shock protein A
MKLRTKISNLAISALSLSKCAFLILFIFFSQLSFAQSTPTAFTQEDRDRIIRTETRLDEGFKQIDKRFEQIDKRFEQVDKRFEQVNQRIEQTNTFMGWMIALFGGMFATTIIFALWDRRTMIRPFETKVKDIEIQIELLKADKTNTSIVSSLRELAKTDSKLADILKMHNLL